MLEVGWAWTLGSNREVREEGRGGEQGMEGSMQADCRAGRDLLPRCLPPGLPLCLPLSLCASPSGWVFPCVYTRACVFSLRASFSLCLVSRRLAPSVSASVSPLCRPLCCLSVSPLCACLRCVSMIMPAVSGWKKRSAMRGRRSHGEEATLLRRCITLFAFGHGDHAPSLRLRWHAILC